MLGDVTDIRERMRAVLPLRWFPDQSPNLDTLLTCLATPWAWFYSLAQYTRSQTRLISALDQWLDLIALTFSAIRFVGGMAKMTLRIAREFSGRSCRVQQLVWPSRTISNI